MNYSGRVSVIIITYNHLDYITEAIESAIAQDYNNKEIIVADDGSDDGTQVIVREYANRYPGLIIQSLSKNNTGIAENFNRGLSHATGEFIAWLGGDDIMLPGKLSAQVSLLKQRSDAVGSYHDAEVFEWPGNKVLGRFSELYGVGRGKVPDIDVIEFLKPKTQLLPSAMMVRRDCIPTGGFDVRLRFANDYLFDFLTLVNGGFFVGSDKVLVRYRKHQSNIGRQSKWAQLISEENHMALAIIDSRYPHLASSTSRRRQYYAVNEAIQSLRTSDNKRFRGMCSLVWHSGAKFRAAGVYLIGPLVVGLLFGSKGQKIRYLLRRIFFY